MFCTSFVKQLTTFLRLPHLTFNTLAMERVCTQSLLLFSEFFLLGTFGLTALYCLRIKKFLKHVSQLLLQLLSHFSHVRLCVTA